MNARKTLLTIGFWILIIGGPVAGWRLYQAPEKGREKVRQLKQKTDKQEKELRIAEFAKRRNAIVGWEMTLPKRGGDPSGPFMIDLSRALIRSNGQPVLLNTCLYDVVEMNGVVTALFAAFGPDDEFLDSPLVAFSLKCSPEQTTELTRAGVPRRARFTIVAKVERVSPLESWVAAQVGDEAGDQPSWGYLRGTCVDLLRLERNKP
jgi:hypothetical protein